MTQRDENTEWIPRFTGGRFWPLDPRPEEIDPVDIAHALGMKCRFTGHTRRFYSVGQHCCLMADAVPDELKRWALMHDAAEAYLPDVARPIKGRLAIRPDSRTGYLADFSEAEEAILQCVAKRFNLPWPMPPELKHWDHVLLATERRDLITSGEVFQWRAGFVEGTEPLTETIRPWHPEDAEAHFRIWFYRLFI